MRRTTKAVQSIGRFRRGRECFCLKREEIVLGRKRHLVWVFSEEQNFNTQKKSKEIKEVLR